MKINVAKAKMLAGEPAFGYALELGSPAHGAVHEQPELHVSAGSRSTGNRTSAVPNTRVSPAAFLTVRSS